MLTAKNYITIIKITVNLEFQEEPRMNREELLNKVKQNPVNDEYGVKQTTRAIFYTTAVCIVVCTKIGRAHV